MTATAAAGGGRATLEFDEKGRGEMMSELQASPPAAMPAPQGATAADMTPIDNEQVQEIIDRLERRYTREQISTAELTRRVRGAYRGFAAAHVRTFVAIFVERLVRRSIETPASTA